METKERKDFGEDSPRGGVVGLDAPDGIETGSPLAKLNVEIAKIADFKNFKTEIAEMKAENAEWKFGSGGSGDSGTESGHESEPESASGTEHESITGSEDDEDICVECGEPSDFPCYKCGCGSLYCGNTADNGCWIFQRSKWEGALGEDSSKINWLVEKYPDGVCYECAIDALGDEDDESSSGDDEEDSSGGGSGGDSGTEHGHESEPESEPESGSEHGSNSGSEDDEDSSGSEDGDSSVGEDDEDDSFIIEDDGLPLSGDSSFVPGTESEPESASGSEHGSNSGSEDGSVCGACHEIILDLWTCAVCESCEKLFCDECWASSYENICYLCAPRVFNRVCLQDDSSSEDDEDSSGGEDDDSSVEAEQVYLLVLVAAATKIQALVRGFRARSSIEPEEPRDYFYNLPVELQQKIMMMRPLHPAAQLILDRLDRLDCVCDNCDVGVAEEVWKYQIFIFTRGDEERCFCEFCAADLTEAMNRDGWVRDDQSQYDEDQQQDSADVGTESEPESASASGSGHESGSENDEDY